MDQRSANWVEHESFELAGELGRNHARYVAERLRADLNYGPEVFSALTQRTAQLDSQFPQGDHLMFVPARDGGQDIKIQHSEQGQWQHNFEIAHLMPAPQMMPPEQMMPVGPPPPHPEVGCTVAGAVVGGVVGEQIGGRREHGINGLLGALVGGVVGHTACQPRDGNQ
jgi:Glycine zipper 2TM domain